MSNEWDFRSFLSLEYRGWKRSVGVYYMDFLGILGVLFFFFFRRADVVIESDDSPT